VPDADVALCVGVHGGVAGVPEEPDVLLVCDGFGVKDVMIDFGIWAEVEKVSGDGMETLWDRVFHCIGTKNRSVDYLYMVLILLVYGPLLYSPVVPNINKNRPRLFFIYF